MTILGIWDGHDSGAALIHEKKIVFAANEERFTRRKLEIDFPRRSIEEALKFAGLEPRDISRIAVSTTDVAKCLTRVFPGLKRRFYKIRRRKLKPNFLTPANRRLKYYLTLAKPNALTRRISHAAVRSALTGLGFRDFEIIWVDHHTAHAASAVCTSGFEKGLFLSLDGIGDGLSGMIGTFEGADLHILKTYSGRNSLGLFFEHVTNLLNMRELEDEGKVMALASFAYPIPDEHNPLLDLFHLDGYELKAKHGTMKMYSVLKKILWQYPSEQFAYMAQRVLEVNIVNLVEQACRRTGLKTLVYAGGVASNIKVNQLLKNSPALEHLYVFPHMGDGGLALGAALAAGLKLNGKSRYPLPDLFLGPELPLDDLESIIEDHPVEYKKLDDIEAEAARLIGRGEILLWYQGRMEYGPRALGHRSILTLPGDISLKNRLNIFLKKRVWYQPFCPSMLEEEARRILADHHGVNNPHMTSGYTVGDEFTERLMAVINTDNSCRPQILSGQTTRYHRLLKHCRDVYGLGVVLNTSFNTHGEPLINTPEEALALLVNSRFNFLVLEDFLIWKK